ncbi:MAG TPA: sigma-54 dependent transcriptional regulator [Polyangia bacterium]|nr:sigma-54 dependent transcriptional regulator [Polyangia bacterium]
MELRAALNNDPLRYLLIGDSLFQRAYGRLLRAHGFEAADADEDAALEAAETRELAGVVLLLRRGAPSALSLFEAIRRARPALPVLVMSYQPTVAEAVKLMQLGAHAYAPVALDASGVAAPSQELLDNLRSIAQAHSTQPQSQRPSTPERVRPLDGQGLVGRSVPMRAVLRDVALVAPTRTTVLILGETGSGKERIAQAIHQGSPRRGASFVAVNCAAISETLLESALFGHEKGAFSGAHCRREGLFKIADGGTLFLDEIGETSPALQAKLLRVLQERQFERVGGTTPVSTDVRVVAATNRDLRQMVAERAFRPDLFYRLNVMVIQVPPLRDRRDDIELLVSQVLGRLSFELGIPRPRIGPEILERFAEYGWPGNVRELENVLERLLVVSQDRTVGLEDLPAEVREADVTPQPAVDGGATADGRPVIPGASFREIERHAILATYEACGQSPSRTAHVLGLSPRTVHYRLREYRGEAGRRAPPLSTWPSRDEPWPARARSLAPSVRASHTETT